MADETVTIEIRAVDRASSAIRRIGGTLGNLATIAAGLVAFRTLEKIAGGIFNLGKKAAEAYEWFDRIRFSLQELARADIADRLAQTGQVLDDWNTIAAQAADSAKELLDWVIQLALTSPFTAEDVNKMFRLIRAYGFATAEAKDLTGIILDFATATGFGSQVLERMGLALGQVRQRGRLAGEEIRQLINVGIPVRDIVAKAMEITTEELEKLIRAGKVAADVALPAIVEWMTRFDGASERAVRTWYGLRNNMKDVIDLNLIALFEGIAKALTPGMQGLFDLLAGEDFRAQMENLGQAIGEFLVPIIDKIPDAVEFMKMLGLAIRGLTEGWLDPVDFLTFIANLTGIIGSDEARRVNDTLTAWAKAIGDFSSEVGTFLGAWLGPMKDDFPLWIESISNIATTTWDSFVPMFERFVESLGKMSDAGADQIITNLTEALQQFDEWWAGGAADRAAEIVEFLLTLVSGGVIGGLLLLTTAIASLADLLAGRDPTPRLEAMMSVFENLATALTETAIFQGFAESISMLFMPLPTAVEGTTTSVANEIAGNFVGSFGESMTTREEEMAGDVVEVLDAMGISAEQWGEFTGKQKTEIVGNMLAQGLGDGFADEMDKQKERMRKKLEEIIELVNEMYQYGSPSKLFMGMGENLMIGLADGIADGTKEAIKSASIATQKVIDEARAQLGIASPSKVLEEIGRLSMQGLAQGIYTAGAPVAAMAQIPQAQMAQSPAAQPSPTVVYAPTISLADEREVRQSMEPVIRSAFERGVQNRTIPEYVVRKKLAADII